MVITGDEGLELIIKIGGNDYVVMKGSTGGEITGDDSALVLNGGENW